MICFDIREIFVEVIDNEKIKWLCWDRRRLQITWSEKNINPLHYP